MWNGSGDSEAGSYSCACGCSVHSAAESAKDSVRFFTISGLAARLFATVRKTEGCSVDISIDAAASPDIVCDSVTGKARAVRSFSLFPERPGLVVAILRPNLLRVKYDRGKSKRQGRKIPALVFGTEAAAESRTRAFIPAPAEAPFFSQFLLYPTALAIERHLPDPMSRCLSSLYFSRITGHWAVTAVWMSLAASSGERSSCSPLCIFFTEHRPFSISSSPRRTA